MLFLRCYHSSVAYANQKMFYGEKNLQWVTITHRVYAIPRDRAGSIHSLTCQKRPLRSGCFTRNFGCLRSITQLFPLAKAALCLTQQSDFWGRAEQSLTLTMSQK